MVSIFIRDIEAAQDNEQLNRRKNGGGDWSLIISITTLKHRLFFSVIWFTYRKIHHFDKRYSHAISNTNKICNISITPKYLAFFLRSQSLFPTPNVPGNHLSDLCPYSFAVWRISLEMESHNVQDSVSGFFNLAQILWYSTIWCLDQFTPFYCMVMPQFIL